MNYLYNGVELPALPEWDKKAYPYAALTGYNANAPFMTSDGRKDVYLFVSTEPLTIGKSNISATDNRYYLCDLTNCPYWTCDITENPGEWIRGGRDVYGHDSRSIYDPDLNFDKFRFMWSNHDIKYLSKVAVPASDPVPVRSPSAMMLGYQVGQAVRGMRK